MLLTQTQRMASPLTYQRPSRFDRRRVLLGLAGVPLIWGGAHHIYITQFRLQGKWLKYD